MTSLGSGTLALYPIISPRAAAANWAICSRSAAGSWPLRLRHPRGRRGRGRAGGVSPRLGRGQEPVEGEDGVDGPEFGERPAGPLPVGEPGFGVVLAVEVAERGHGPPVGVGDDDPA